jgi:hypothetical protein
MRSERLRMRADLVEMIAGAKLTITRSRALLAAADATEQRKIVACGTKSVVFRRGSLKAVQKGGHHSHR